MEREGSARRQLFRHTANRDPEMTGGGKPKYDRNRALKDLHDELVDWSSLDLGTLLDAWGWNSEPLLDNAGKGSVARIFSNPGYADLDVTIWPREPAHPS